MSFPKRVLIVTDNEAFLSSAGEKLHQAGCVLDRVSSARELTMALEANACDLVVVDLNAAANQSCEFLRVIHRGDYDIPVVAVTGEPQPPYTLN